jgi:methylated-DNA-[protein]-cysteine S-methyltransferase
LKKISRIYYNSPVGELILGSHGYDLCIADWRYRKMRSAIDIRIQTALNAEYVKQSSPVLQETIRQLDAYFYEGSTEFDIPIQLVGTSFQQKVWTALNTISYGKTETYLGLSKNLGNEKAIRAVATANGANALAIIIPCHRIIGSDGSLVGYAGGLPAKKKLLALENPDREQQLELF